MDRYNEVKVLLKKWEMTFLQEHQRKPSKTDMEEAPEETKKLYREYKALKQAREHQGFPESSSVCQQAAKETPAVEQVPDSGCWGAHLNRGQTVPKLSHQDRDNLKASAQYFGMKLKANLGAAIKERPITLRKSLTPRGKPAVPLLEKSSDNSNQGASPKPPQMPSLKSSKDCVTNADPNESGDLLLPPSISRLVPTILSARLKPSPEVNKFQQLKQTVAQRLGSLDPGWLDRCQGIREKVGERSREESASTSNGRNKDQTKAGCALQGNVAQPLHDHSLNQTTGARAQSLESEHVPPLGNCLLGSWKLQEHQDPSRRNWQGTALEGDDLIKGGGDDCRAAVKDEQGTSETQGNSGMDSSLGAAEISIAKEHISKPKNLPKDAHQGAELEKLGNAAGGEGGASCRTGDGPSQPKQVKVGNRKRQRMAPASRDDGAAGPEDGAVAPKRRRTSASAGDNPASVKKKARGAVCEPKPGKNNLEEDGESVEAKEEKGRDVPMLSENLLGEVEGEGKHKWSSRASVCRAPPKKDGNFVRLNLKKKSHVKGYALRGHRLRKQVWKQKWQKKGEWFGGGGRCFDRGSDTCFRCGGTGHWASECKGRELGPAVGPQPEENSEAIEEEMPLPTLEEVAQMTNTAYSKISAESRSSQAGPERAGEEEFDLHMQRPVYEPPAPPPPMEPLYGLGQDGKVRETPEEVFQALAELGYSAFRQGQEVAVMRILSGLSTLVVLSTGMGKSLCYQLPAYLYAKRSKCITLVISPLVSLMDDQISGLPPHLKAVCIHSNMSKSQREAAVERVKGGKVHVLLLSPEALVGGGRVGSSCLPSADQLPPVAFACIDEAHCVSEWSHNFRPCYLRLCKVLRDRLGVRCLLGLTATATLATARDVAHHLGIQEEEGIAVRSAAVPPNLHLSVSTDRDKDQALVLLLQGERFGGLDSVIVYCTRREETARIAALIRTRLQGVTLRESMAAEEQHQDDSAGKRKKAKAKKSIRCPLKWIADSYHSGMSAIERRRVQNNFMCGQLRIVVATVAFGMGLDKSDVRGIVHYNMPKNFESYVQEIGRAGRDGKPAHCHLFLDPEGGDLHELRRHIYADTVDFFTIKKLVQKVFPRCKCLELHRKQQDLNRGGEVLDAEMMELMRASEEQACRDDRMSGQQRVCYKHERAIPMQQTVESLDIREEGIETLLCYLELHPQCWVEMLHPTFSSCRVVCYGGPQQLRATAQSSPPVAVCLARERLAGVDHTHASSVEFDVIALSDSMGWEVLPVKRALRQLQWSTQLQKGCHGTGNSGILVEFSDLSFHLRSYGDLTDQEMDSVCNFLHHRVTSRETATLCQLQACFRAFQSVACQASALYSERVDKERSSRLKALLMDYFEKKPALDETELMCREDEEAEDLNNIKLREWEGQIRSDIRNFLSIRQDEKFSGRAIARIFHGIGSPCYPAQVYGRDRRFWRKYIHFDFNRIMRLATEEIIRCK
ncbi:ATP-dependent DNA helicase Q4 isoform X1 [Gopherus evgoodei]|uniref:ATP-dependent DNA helicase Q4 isoform X1 n=1 Tax=Gopherus evgoodei TaxID=1825980 RepID=UPI0011CEF81B|nr:ATP-dependent DNA helicase Q4 isoform X1 [Gopherus evgoodei]XP_030409825.1 ATP-dependent DNA helicase Q4 isoform X1 [Gopherus evgoodei]XP_030409826.1 ATP-dependent DNA helicase Q4 isoform X1 [Gopherus evgoodei]